MGKVGATTKGYIKNLNTGSLIRFQYNPETFEYSRSATYTEIASPGMSYPDTQYVRGNARSFSVELFLFDKPYTGIIDNHKSFLDGLLPPEVNSNSYTRPPEILFVYGSFIKKCVLEELSIKVEEYDNWGRPTNARFNLTLRQVRI